MHRVSSKRKRGRPTRLNRRLKKPKPLESRVICVNEKRTDTICLYQSVSLPYVCLTEDGTGFFVHFQLTSSQSGATCYFSVDSSLSPLLESSILLSRMPRFHVGEMSRKRLVIPSADHISIVIWNYLEADSKTAVTRWYMRQDGRMSRVLDDIHVPFNVLYSTSLDWIILVTDGKPEQEMKQAIESVWYNFEASLVYCWNPELDLDPILLNPPERVVSELKRIEWHKRNVSLPDVIDIVICGEGPKRIPKFSSINAAPHCIFHVKWELSPNAKEWKEWSEKDELDAEPPAFREPMQDLGDPVDPQALCSLKTTPEKGAVLDLDHTLWNGGSIRCLRAGIVTRDCIYPKLYWRMDRNSNLWYSQMEGHQIDIRHVSFNLAQECRDGKCYYRVEENLPVASLSGVPDPAVLCVSPYGWAVASSLGSGVYFFYAKELVSRRIQVGAYLKRVFQEAPSLDHWIRDIIASYLYH